MDINLRPFDFHFLSCILSKPTLTLMGLTYEKLLNFFVDFLDSNSGTSPMKNY
jgi:hypothetical protein